MKTDWEYIDEYRRKDGQRHQLYIEGKWSDIQIPSGWTIEYKKRKIEPDFDWENEVKNAR
tara:strand:- start:108 stop:287 length:180 start_codon:yes stop_codon:yes gene_type:complete